MTRGNLEQPVEHSSRGSVQPYNCIQPCNIPCDMKLLVHVHVTSNVTVIVPL